MSSNAGEGFGISECMELHVFLVPDEMWNSRLNKVSVEAIDCFISAGFIRVYSDASLKAIRDELGVLLGPERVTDKYSFLKCVGRSLALVKAKQEKDLKARSFAPPYAPYPELYLLPVEEHASSLYSRSLSSDTAIYNPDSQTGSLQRPALAPGRTKEPVKFPLIKQGPQPSVLDQSLEDEDTYNSSKEREDGSLGCEESMWTETSNMCRGEEEQPGIKQHYEKSHSERDPASVNAFRTPEASSFNKTVNETTKGEKRRHYKKDLVRDSGPPESVEELDNGQSIRTTRERTRNKSSDEVHGDRMESLLPVASNSTSSPHSPALYMSKTTWASSTIREQLLKEIRLVKEERKSLESTRQDLLRKGKDLLALNRHRRNQARDKWKRMYFDTKKATAPLEETLKGLRQELETFYNKLFQQLQAREGRNRQRQPGKSSSTKNDFIIQIMTETCEIDNLKKNMDDAKMKLATEIKLREQAITELRALKAELMQKKSQCPFN